MDDPLGVSEAHGLADAEEETEKLGSRDRLGHPLQALAPDQLHYVVDPAVRQDPRVVHRHDAGMLQSAPGCELPAPAERSSRDRSYRAGAP